MDEENANEGEGEHHDKVHEQEQEHAIGEDACHDNVMPCVEEEDNGGEKDKQQEEGIWKMTLWKFVDNKIHCSTLHVKL